MLYNSFEFIFLFLPICLALYFLAARWSQPFANGTLIACSLAFYSYDASLPAPFLNWRNLALIVLSIAFNYAAGAAIGRTRSRLLLAVAVATNLGVLAYFKYGGFLLSNLSTLTRHDWGTIHEVLPLGISFFTFTQIAFLVDASKGRAHDLNANRYGLFVTFFPHLIAGPIVHHDQLMPQFADGGAKRWQRNHFYAGLAFFTLGLFKKVGIADSVAPWASAAFNSGAVLATVDAWGGALAWTLQLYFDFSGYCDMAIGLAMFFNVRLPDNFDAPYQAESISDFWRRWHMTLSRFLRDYLYIPLGGSRAGERRTRLNLLITMALGGLWHGAGWTFVAWGLYHGVLLVVHRAWRAGHAPLSALIARPLTFAAVLLGWVLFRANSLPHAEQYLRSMLGFPGAAARALPADARTNQWVALGLLTFGVNIAPTTKAWILRKPLGARRAIALASVFFISLTLMHARRVSREPSPFIYFRF